MTAASDWFLATNRLDRLDPAVLRLGRFDDIIGIATPGGEDRIAILKVHLRGQAWTRLL